MPTSPVEPSDHATLPASNLTGEWRRVGAFLKRPTLDPSGPERGPESGKVQTILRVYALDMCVMLALILIATAVVALGVELPETALAGIEITPMIALGVIVAAPVMEELLFRGWLSGKPAHVLALLGFGFGIAAITFFGPTRPLMSVTFGLVGFLGGLAALIALWKRPPMRWFERAFPLFFWFATLAFALIHLFNFDESADRAALFMLLPLVIPQFVLGALLGYLRVRIGLWAAILLHAMHNATALGIALLAMANS